MMVYDSQRRAISLGAEIGRGGEASIYRLAHQPHRLAKIYTRAPLDGYDQKLAWMLANPPDDPASARGHASIAWPQDLLYDSRGRLAGYVMAHIQNAAPILTVFNPRLRARQLPDFDRRYLHRTARNLAAALDALHKRDYVVGDLNESNVMVTPSALVTLIDADSFQVQRRIGARPVVYACPVGKPEYTPPELQGKPFQQTLRLPEHDRFGLGVLIFQLLMEGNHPFRAHWLGSGEPPAVEARIKDGGWPYAASRPRDIAPPRNAPEFSSLHPQLAELMKACFSAGHRDPRQRPAPEDWERVLIEAEKALVPCGSGHYYSSHQRRCPECERLKAAAAAGPAPGSRARRPASQPRVRPSPSIPLQPLLSGLRAVLPVLMQLSGVPVGIRSIVLPYVQPASSVLICSVCGHANPAAEVYCQSCAGGLSGRKRCAHCRRGIPAQARFCPRCGQST